MKSFAQRLSSFFLNRRNLFIIGFVLTAILTLMEVLHGKQNNFFTFQYSTLDFWNGSDPYGFEKYDFLYGPLFFIFFTPFAYLGSTIGPFVWNAFNFALFFTSIFCLPHLTETQKCKSYLFLALILAITQMSMQFNPVVAYLFVFSFILMERGKMFWAVLLIMISGFIKIYGIFELALLLCYPRLWRNMGYVLLIGAVFFLLPALQTGLSGLWPLYQRWVESISEHVDRYQYYDVFSLYPVHDLLAPVMTYVQMGALAVLAVLFVSNYRQFHRFNFRIGAVAILMGWVILFSVSAEKHTYVIALTGFLMWYWSLARRTLFDKILFWSNLVLLVLVPVDLICPPPVMRFLCDTLQINVYCFMLTWLRMLQVTFLKPLFSGSTNPDNTLTYDYR